MKIKRKSKSTKKVRKNQRRSKPVKKVVKRQRKSKTIKQNKITKALKEISALKKRYQIFYDELPDLIRTIDTHGIVLDCNRSFAESFGYSKKEVIGKSVFDFVADESRQEYADAFTEWITTGYAKPGQCWHIRKDGSKFLGLVSANNLYDENGKMIGSNTIIKDITEIHEARKKIQEREKELQQRVVELQKSHDLLTATERKYRNLYEKLPTLLRSITTEGILTHCNEAYAKALGYTKEECIGVSFYNHTAERSIDDLRGNLEKWKKTHEVLHQEIWMKRKDGSIFPTLMSGASLFDEHGNLTGRTVALTDLTEIYETRKKLENDEALLRAQYDELKRAHVLLATTEQRYKHLYEKSPGLLRSITTEGILTDCNEAYAKALGYTKEECIGVSFYNHTAERSIDDLRGNLEKWKKTHEVLHQEIWMKRKDGSIFPSLLTGASLYNERGELIGRTVALTDLTEIYNARKSLEEKEAQIREQYEELTKLDIAKEEFTSMISHELKTPLTPILGWCQALKNHKILGVLTPKQLQAVNAIQSNAARLRDLVGDMLDAQILDMKRMKFDHKDTDVTKMMEFLAKNLRSAMEPKNIEFVNSTTEKIIARSDRSRLEQVLNNLILNAVDFVPPQKGRIEIRAESKDGRILFMVKDNGIGIPKQKQPHLFKKFYHLDTSVTRKYGGSGLGLTICKGIVDALGGEIWIESDSGKGSTFYFTIPKGKLNHTKND